MFSLSGKLLAVQGVLLNVGKVVVGAIYAAPVGSVTLPPVAAVNCDGLKANALVTEVLGGYAVRRTGDKLRAGAVSFCTTRRTGDTLRAGA